jgi:hypothetical protein
MRYRIEMSQTRKGFARVNFPGRIIALAAGERDHIGPVWMVGLTDLSGSKEASVAVRADSAGDAVWRVAQATVRAVSQLTDNPIEGDIQPSPDDFLDDSA